MTLTRRFTLLVASFGSQPMSLIMRKEMIRHMDPTWTINVPLYSGHSMQVSYSRVRLNSAFSFRPTREPLNARRIRTTLLDGDASVVSSTATGAFYALPSKPS